MDICTQGDELRRCIRVWRKQDNRVACVPTMGNLHAGHLKLVRHARAIAERVVVSIFVNPMQFGPGEDYESYPLTMDLDKAALMDEDADLLFIPTVQVMYPNGSRHTTVVEVPGLNSLLEGEHRPAHMNGVSTVVAKLFGMIQPDIAVFGEKDYQQLLLVQRMVHDLCLPIEIAAVETVRETDGLAMSSRNNYLQPQERVVAPELYRLLCRVKTQVEGGETGFAGIEAAALEELAAVGFRPDYVSIRRAADLGEPGTGDTRLRVLAAAWLGAARLIDNIDISIS
ncbi:MAG: pantoate--beta-alanine ligase [Gammaproteobacteria bacterium]|nr:pantoate--beta-alanine ligase [Gammaproteobacteria bacterium]